MGCVTNISNPYAVLINEMPHYLKDICSAVGSITWESDTDSTMVLLMEKAQDLSQMSSITHWKVSSRKKRWLYPYNRVPELKDPHSVAISEIVIMKSGESVQKKMRTYPEGQNAFMLRAAFTEGKKREKKERKENASSVNEVSELM